MKTFYHRRISDFLSTQKKLTPKKIFFWLFYSLVGLFVLGMATLAIAVLIINFSLPSIDELKNISLAKSTFILDRDGQLLYSIHGEENRKYIPLNEMSQNLINATLAIEDDQFYEHAGFDIPAILKSVAYEFFGIGTPRGGSTITQQFVKNYFLTREKSYVRKLKEFILAVKLERALSKNAKNKILELYLNIIPYGNNAFGIQQASQIYFKKDAKDLSIAESAILASLPQAPTFYSPYGQHRYSSLNKEFSAEELKDRPIKELQDLEEEEFTRGLLGKTYKLADETELYILGRSDLVLRRMLELNYITETDFQTAKKEIASAIQFTPHRQTILAPHFVFYVKNYLEKKYGKEMVEQGGLKVTTTLNQKYQLKAEELVSKYAEINKKKYDAQNAALIATDPKTGQILAMVGSADFFNQEIDGQVNILTQKLQPGSSFKPIIYAAAFLKKYSPATVVYDVSTKFGTSTQKIKNYDDKYIGPISLRAGLGLSRNIPAIKAFYLGGMEKEIVPLAKSMGLSSLKDDGSLGISMALGSAEIPFLELVQAYGVFATNGFSNPPVSVLKVESADGQILEEWQPPLDSKPVLDEQVAYLINNILSDPVINLGRMLRLDSAVIAAKTGTANKKVAGNKILPSQTWAIGYTPNIVVGTWAGNSDAKQMKALADGYTCAAPIMNNFLAYVFKEIKPEPFSIPSGIKHITVSKLSGLLPSEDTPEDKIVSETFASFAVPEKKDDRYTTIKIDKLSKKIATEWTPPYLVEEKSFLQHKDVLDIPEWQIAINDFVREMHQKDPNNPDYEQIPLEIDNLHTAENDKKQPTIKIISPKNFTKIKAQPQNIFIEVNAPLKIDIVEYYVNDDLQYKESSSPYTGKIRLFPALSGNLIKVKARVIDNFGYRAEDEVELQVE